MLGHEQLIPTDAEEILLEQSRKEALARYLRLAELAAAQTGKSILEIIKADLAEKMESDGKILISFPQLREAVTARYTFSTPYGNLVYYPSRHQAISPLLPNETFVQLSPIEGLLLEALMIDPGAWHTSNKLHSLFKREFNEAPGPIFSNRVNVAIHRLRTKLGDHNIGPNTHNYMFRLIHTATPGLGFFGYSLTPHPRGT